MADVHVHNDTIRPVAGSDASDSGVAMMVFTLIAVLAVAAFAFFAFNGALFNNAVAPSRSTTNINVTTPDPTPTTNPGATTPSAQ